LRILVAVEDLRRRLIGVWRVTRYDDRESVDEPWTESHGPGVDGLLVYDQSGWLSVQITGETGPFSYFGRFEVIEIGELDGDVCGVLHHTIVASSCPELLAADPERPFRISGDTLVLGDDETWRRVFERVG
jgi:hypothetical protein